MSKVANIKKMKPSSQSQEAGSNALAIPANNKELQGLMERINQLTTQLRKAEDRLAELENIEIELQEKEKEIDKRLLELAEVKREQESDYQRRVAELEEKRKEGEEEFARRMAEVEKLRAGYEEEYQGRLAAFESEMKERSDEIRKYLELEFRDKEENLVKREGQVMVRESIVAEKEKFWSSMYDAVVKLTRVASASK